MKTQSNSAGNGARKPKLQPVPVSLAAEFLSTALAELKAAGVAVRAGNSDGCAVVILPGLSVQIIDGRAVFAELTPAAPEAAPPA